MSKIKFRRFSNFLEEVKWEQEHPEEVKKKWEEIIRETIALIKKKKENE